MKRRVRSPSLLVFLIKKFSRNLLLKWRSATWRSDSSHGEVFKFFSKQENFCVCSLNWRIAKEMNARTRPAVVMDFQCLGNRCKKWQIIAFRWTRANLTKTTRLEKVVFYPPRQGSSRSSFDRHSSPRITPSANASDTFRLNSHFCAIILAISCAHRDAASYHYYFLIDVDLFLGIFFLLSTRRNRNKKWRGPLTKHRNLISEQCAELSPYNGPLCFISLISGFNLALFSLFNAGFVLCCSFVICANYEMNRHYFYLRGHILADV